MRIEKREMTLNERDTLADMQNMERALIRAYADAALYAERKESRLLIVAHLGDTANETFMLCDLLSGISKDG